ncbi:MAG: rod shape-determining protein MreC [Chitinophagales bacterium]
MRSFFLFIIRHYAIFLFLLLEGISLYCVFTYNSFQKTSFINSANIVTGNVQDTYGNFRTYFSLGKVNDSLMAENARLRALLPSATRLDSAKVSTAADSLGKALYTFIPATVIGNSYTEANNFITLDKGSAQGVKEDMGVITSSGIVGRVVKVSQNFSVVMSVLHSSFVKRVAVKRNGAQGSLIWEGKDPTHAAVVQVSEPGTLFPGDTIVTSVGSEMFPRDIMVGTLESYGKDQGSNYYTLQIKLAVNFSALEYVYIVNDLMKDEREGLVEEAEDAGF